MGEGAKISYFGQIFTPAFKLLAGEAHDFLPILKYPEQQSQADPQALNHLE